MSLLAQNKFVNFLVCHSKNKNGFLALKEKKIKNLKHKNEIATIVASNFGGDKCNLRNRFENVSSSHSSPLKSQSNIKPKVFQPYMLHLLFISQVSFMVSNLFQSFGKTGENFHSPFSLTFNAIWIWLDNTEKDFVFWGGLWIVKKEEKNHKYHQENWEKCDWMKEIFYRKGSRAEATWKLSQLMAGLMILFLSTENIICGLNYWLGYMYLIMLINYYLKLSAIDLWIRIMMIYCCSKVFQLHTSCDTKFLLLIS